MAKAAKVKPAANSKKAPCGYKIDSPAGRVIFDLSVAKESLEAVLGAAYLLTDRAFIALDGDRKKSLKVTIFPKVPAGEAGLKALVATFNAELETQKVRWAIAKNNLPVREFIAEQAVLIANGRLPAAPAEPSGGPPPAEELNDEQRKEIEKLIAEVELEIKAINDKKAPGPSSTADPKKIAESWEAKQESASMKPAAAAKGGPGTA